MNRIGMLLTATALLFPQCVVGTNKCDVLRKNDQETLISYLKNKLRSEDEPSCIRYVLKELGARKATTAIPALIDYLDYKRPLDNKEKQGFYLHAPDEITMYPAISALFEIGEAADPFLLQVIESADSTQTKRDNAILALMLIHRESMPDAIRALTARSASATDIDKAERFRTAAADAVRWCVPETKSRCEETAKGGR